MTSHSRKGVEAAPSPASAAPEHEPTPPQSEAARPNREWSSNHPVNLRLSLPLLFGRYYVTIVAGKERRSTERLAEEREKHPVKTFGNVIFMASIGGAIGLAILFIVQSFMHLIFAAG